jgi:hypothetical protein
VKDPYTGNYVTIPGSVTNVTPNSATPTTSAMLSNASGTSGGSQVNLTVHALDSQNIIDHSPAIAQAVYNELNRGGALSQRIQQTILNG